MRAKHFDYGVGRTTIIARQLPSTSDDALRRAGSRAAATFTDDPSGAPTKIHLHVHGHLGWPAGAGYRVVALTPLEAVRYGGGVHVDSLTGLRSEERGST